MLRLREDVETGLSWEESQNKWRRRGALFVITDPNVFPSHLCCLWNECEGGSLSRSRRPATQAEESGSCACLDSCVTSLGGVSHLYAQLRVKRRKCSHSAVHRLSSLQINVLRRELRGRHGKSNSQNYEMHSCGCVWNNSIKKWIRKAITMNI